ncbi:origin recognition complex subunit 2-domain-containing protein [Lasiosphaeria miniovina]|uniref:Origin recognition complex subunit 2 n=1 Tax=Lasiosphaeria miniovina TaxID=1954250 RepID=A0AA40B5N3_9PEZI|nr:origin recognition complex subunit 2-domain-containing protein [Lasiosphaeria miniovina]KAK0728156.1 origin recognition complex subunit 2-domain-containing protein [Lasiosphaeria miniovina]
MVRRKSTEQESASRPARKRELPLDHYEVPDETTSPKRRRGPNKNNIADTDIGAATAKASSLKALKEVGLVETITDGANGPQSSPQPTPVKKRRGRPPKVKTGEAANVAAASTPLAKRRKNVAATPVKLNGINGVDTPSRRNNADRSARRKSARALIDRVFGGALSDDEDEDGGIAREIYESSEDEEGDQEGQEARDDDQEGPDPTTPSKKRGRPRKAVSARKRSPTPPRDLPPHEQYFYQNKPGLTKTSSNNLSSLDLLTHEEYFSVLRQLKDPHASDVEFLQSLHAESFPQWSFEISQGFSTCLYGYGSKRRLLHQFATYLSERSLSPQQPKVVIVNGYVRTTTIREILSTISNAIDPSYKLVSGNPVVMVQNLLSLLSTTGLTVVLIINSIDAPPLRKAMTQSILAQLAAHTQIRLVCSADTPNFHLLWDSGLRSSFNFAFHDCTTFGSFGTEIDAVDEVHELLGRKARHVGGKEGVTYVLRSLPENAKSLFRLLVSEVLAMMDEGGGITAEGPGIEYRILYNKAVEEFICSSEMAFRTLLKEFHDHQIITSHKDSIGTELLSLPFRKDELEAILEDLMS